MKRFQLFIACGLMMFVAATAHAENNWLPSWLGGPKKPEAKTNQRHHKAHQSASAKSSSKSGTLFSGFKNPFKSPSTTNTPVKQSGSKPTMKRTKNQPKKSWFGSLFQPQEPEPPRSISEWMDLKQIKP